MRPFSGEVCEGDTFGFRGVYSYKKFKVLSIRHSRDHHTLVCEGTLDFDDEITRIMLDTDYIVMPPPDLPLPAQMPIATPREERMLEISIDDWTTRAPVQRAICLCMYRGIDTHEQIAATLGLTAHDVSRSLQTVFGVIGGGPTGKLWFA